MKLVYIILLVSSSHCFSHYNNGVLDEAMTVMQGSLAPSLKKTVPELLESWTVNLLRIPRSKNHLNQKCDFNSTNVISQTLSRLKNIPDRVPLIPFAFAEPVSKGMLVFFATFNSSFVNLTNFECKVSMNKSSRSRTWMAVDLYLNSSSLTGRYELDVSSYDIHLFGDGTYRVIFEGTDATFNASVITFNDDTFEMTGFYMNISIPKAHVSMTDLLGGDAPQSLLDFIGEIVPQQISLLNETLEQTVSQTVTSFINNVIAKIFSWSEVVRFIEMFAEH